MLSLTKTVERRTAPLPQLLEPRTRRSVRATVAPPTRPRRATVDRWLAAALAITAIAFALRFIGFGYGLPFHYHWDEPTLLNRAIRMGGGDLNPHYFSYPSLLMYMFLIGQGALYVAGRVIRIYSSPDAFLISYLTDSTASYVVGRVIVAAAGTATVFVTYVVGRRFITPAAGVLAALVLAVSPVHVSNSHFATNDVPMAFFATLSLVFLWQVYRRGLWRDYILAGVVIGLAISTKYLPAGLLISLGLAHIFRLHMGGERWTLRSVALQPAVAGVVAFLAFAVTSPYVLLDWQATLRDLHQQSVVSGAAGCASCQLNFVPYLTQTMGWSVGWPAYLLALAGLVAIPFQRGEQRLRFALLASWPVILFVMLGTEQQPWPRWLSPIAPFAALSAAATFLGAWGWAIPRLGAEVKARRKQPAWPRIARAALVAVGVGVILGPPAVSSLRYDGSLVQLDTRTQAVQWFEANVPNATKVAIQPLLDRYFLTAQLRTESQLAIEESWIPDTKLDARQKLEQVYRSGPVYDDVPFTYDYDQLKATGARYVVISSAHFHAVDPRAEDALYAQLSQRGRLVKRFAPAVDLPDADYFPVAAPVITVYELP